MDNSYNFPALARQVSDKLKFTQDEQAKLCEELSQIPDGYVKNALDMLSMTEPKRYIACVKADCVKAEYQKKDHDDIWTGANDMGLFLGIVEAETPTRAKQIAAVHMCMDSSIIEVTQI